MGKALGEVSLGTVLGQIFQLSTRFSIAVQPQYNLLQKTMMMAEGVARQLNPDADMWSLARPLASDWMTEQAHISRRIESVLEEALTLASRLPRLIAALESRDTESPPPASGNGTALAVALLALGIAALSIFI